jgi:hypothetical protein
VDEKSPERDRREAQYWSIGDREGGDPGGWWR